MPPSPYGEYDAIVVGGGPAGCHTAIAIARYSQQRLRILLIDRNPREELGKKTLTGWSCGDAVSKRSIDFIKENLGVSYSKPELEHSVKGVVAYSPDHETRVLFDGEGYVLNRKLWPQKQLAVAEKLGVEFAFEVSAKRLLHEDGFVKGVEGFTNDGTPFRARAKVVIDASGSASILRANLPIKSYIEKEIDRDDLESTGRYIIEFDEGEEDPSYFDPDYCLIHLDQYLAPGGYAWTFPKGRRKANVGLGVQKKALERRNGRFGRRDTLRSLMEEYLKSNKAIRNPRTPKGEEDQGNTYSTWQVPVRRPNDCLVANGYAIIGDAAWMPRPIDAGGIGPALYASVLLGRTVAHALEARDVSERGLWSYCVEYMKSYGSQMASFEVLRRFLQNLSNEQISYGMRHFLSYDDIERITRREHPSFSRVKLLNPFMLWRILAHWSLADGLRYTVKKHRALMRIYAKYPEEPHGFENWRKLLMRELCEAYSRFP